MSKAKKTKQTGGTKCRERNLERQITNKIEKNVCERSVDKRQKNAVLQSQRALLLKNGTTMRRGTERGRGKIAGTPQNRIVKSIERERRDR